MNAPTKTENSALTRRARRRDRAPADWREKRLRFALSLNPSWREAAHLKDEDEVSFVPMEAVGELGGLDLSATKPIGEVGSGYTFFADGDVVVAKITPCFENGKGALARNLRNGVAFGTTELHVLRANRAELCPEYLFYLSISQPFRAFGQSSMYGAGGQKRVAEEFVKNFRWPLPPLSEQRAIAAFLDRETARIDALIEKKRRLIELLQEKRASVVTQVVTRGVDSGVELKQTGVPWLSMVPRHWEVRRLRFVIQRIEQGWSPQCDNQPAELDEWGVLKAGAVNGYALDEREQKRLPENLAPLRELEVRPGDILMSRANTRELLGSAVYLPAVRPRLLLCDKLYRLTLDPTAAPVLPKFLVHFLRSHSGRAALEREATGTSGSMQNIGQDTVLNAVVPVPPLGEQRALVDRIELVAEQTEQAAAVAGRLVDRLSELRSALIAAAVTGQIDVREAA